MSRAGEQVRSPRYADHRPYPQPPQRLDELRGPTEGVIELPRAIHWGPDHVYDLSVDADRRVAYERVLREAGSTDEVAFYVNGAVLGEVWPRLWLPERLRRMWEEAIPELASRVA